MSATPQTAIERAIVMALRAHHGQYDKAQEPYILHPMRVMGSATLIHEDWRVAAGLHDVAEPDAAFPVPLEDIRRCFGAEVGEMVDNLTHWPGERLRHYWDRCRDHPGSWAVKIADIKDNLNRIDGLPDWSVRQRLLHKYHTALAYLLPKTVNPMA
jgi:GTP diphosphokinase / guanosine-3',5'-bis(diphosphate) 3'-diphosphatase